MQFLKNGCALLLLFGWLLPVHGEEGCAHVVDARASQSSSGGTWTFHATVSSTETGWDKYADEWRVQDLQGNILGTRTLLHPHENEQPFTRSLSGVDVPEDVAVVTISAQDSVLGYCGDRFELVIRETEDLLVETAAPSSNSSNNESGSVLNESFGNNVSDVASTSRVSSETKQHPPVLIIEDTLLETSKANALSAPLTIPLLAMISGWGIFHL